MMKHGVVLDIAGSVVILTMVTLMGGVFEGSRVHGFKGFSLNPWNPEQQYC
jgi:hypothetical protein